ncbi:MAG: TadE/TadG family type IV pilus assembly protein [Anaerolineae bacterium]
MNNHLRKTPYIEKTPTQYKKDSTHQLKNDGQSLVEFALVLGLIVVIFIGAVDIFNLLQQKADLDKMLLQAARQAGEFGGSGDGNEVEAYIRAQMISMGYSQPIITEALDSLDFTAKKYAANAIVDLTPTEQAELGTGECKYGQLITVSMAVNWETNIPIVLFFNGFNGAGTFEIQSTARCWRAL